MQDNRVWNTGSRNAHGSIAGAIFFLLAGPVLWAGHFTLIYGTQSALCAFQIEGDGGWRIVAAIAIATIIVLSGQLFLLLRPRAIAGLLNFRSARPEDRSFAYAVSRTLTCLSMVGVAMSGATVFALDVCAHFR